MKQFLTYYQTQSFGVRLYIIIRVLILDFNRITSYFPAKVNSIMELACGYGLASFLLAKKYEPAPINSYDIDQSRIKTLSAMNPFNHLSFHAKNILEIQNYDSDVVFMSDLLHHLTYEHQKELLEGIHDTASDDSILIIKDMDKGRFSFRQFCNYMIDLLHAKEKRFYYRDKASFLDLFNACGYTVKCCDYINRWYIPLNHVLFVLEKNKKNPSRNT